MTTDPAAVTEGVYGAVLDIVDAAGSHPLTREEIIGAVQEGVRLAVDDHLVQHPLNAEMALRREDAES